MRMGSILWSMQWRSNVDDGVRDSLCAISIASTNGYNISYHFCLFFIEKGDSVIEFDNPQSILIEAIMCILDGISSGNLIEPLFSDMAQNVNITDDLNAQIINDRLQWNSDSAKCNVPEYTTHSKMAV